MRPAQRSLPANIRRGGRCDWQVDRLTAGEQEQDGQDYQANEGDEPQQKHPRGDAGVFQTLNGIAGDDQKREEDQKSAEQPEGAQSDQN
ncbi:hypothetical protein CSB93_6612 (plasmid) [Pseudomonas paraeruginosa]|uniref:Uncharacterized protein n=1 Tax=Pseudomonas paraeruginosa TaxID=2994495 RepID=A0A2R3J4W0_9PSED|nr:hypothetical protein CSB93_6612 [Pseudomonas paraeruginosa]